MAATSRHPVRRPLVVAAAVAAVIAAGIAWLVPDRGGSGTPTRSFWSLVSGNDFEVNPPQDVDEISRRADAIVVAHVSGIVDGRQDPGSVGTTPALDGTPPPRSCFVQLTVDKVVKGAVTEQQVLNMEMLTPPAQLGGLAAARDKVPHEELLFFLNEGAASARRGNLGPVVELAEKGIYWPVGSKGVVASNADGLVLALRPSQPDVTFLRSFSASTVDAAAARAAQSVR